MSLFLDSSALAKRYLLEPGTEVVAARCREADEIIVSILSVPEVLSAFNRLRRERKIGARRYAALKRELAHDMEQATIVALDATVVRRTILCLEQSSMHTADAIHVASAIEAGSDLFLSADRRQCDAAASFKLRVEVVPL